MIQNNCRTKKPNILIPIGIDPQGNFQLVLPVYFLADFHRFPNSPFMSFANGSTNTQLWLDDDLLLIQRLMAGDL